MRIRKPSRRSTAAAVILDALGLASIGVMLGCGLLASAAYSQTVEYEALDGEPFGRVIVRNICGDADGEHRVETARGAVVLRYDEGDNGCASQPDTIRVETLPPDVGAVPPFLDLIENEFGPSDPGVILLYTYRGM